MFLTMFGASALATILFAPKNTQNYSSQFNSLNEGINKLDGKLDSLLDASTFMKARSCLTEFSPRLIGEPTLSYTHHSIDDIMVTAKAGFDELLETAKADDNNFITARAIFAKTYGNAEWISAQFANQLAKYAQLDTLINNYSIKSLVETECRYEHEFEALERTCEQYENLGWFQYKKKCAVQEKLFEIQRNLITISNEFAAKASMDLDEGELYILFKLVQERSDVWANCYDSYKKGIMEFRDIGCDGCIKYLCYTQRYEDDFPWLARRARIACPIPCSLEQKPWSARTMFINRNRKLLNILLSDKTITRRQFRA